MPAPEPPAPASPFAAILSWSETFPDWQRDALRRIVTSGPLNADDLKELEAISRAEHVLQPTTGTTPTAVPLVADHIPGGADGAESVSLSKLSSLQNVGRLLKDQEIDFGSAPGLTVIYGENGAGKSGYARVIKKACRARGTAQDIKPDVFDLTSTGPAKAMIGCRIGTVETSVDWTDGDPSDPHLSNIFVFDSFSARAHVGENGPACFTPRGLDVLPGLAKACDWIKGRVQTELEEVEKQITNARDEWGRNGTTAVAIFVNAINADTRPEEIDAVVFSEADEKRLAEIIATLSADPKIKAADTTAAAKRIRRFADNAKNRATSVDDTAMQDLGDAIRDAESSANAAKAAAGPELKDTDLPGSCNDGWRKLWDAAKAYSVAHAYPDKQFPVTEAGAKCVLCQQPLQAEAIDRYARFNKFVADETRKQADAATAKVTAMKPGVDSLSPIGTEAAGIKADLDRESPGMFATIEAFATAVDARIAHAQKCLKDGTWTDAPTIPNSPCADLLTFAEKLDKRAIEEDATANPEQKKQAEAERDELTDRKWLVGKKDEVMAQISRCVHAAKLQKCCNDCTTNAITRKSRELHKAHVTATLSKAFEEECRALGMETLTVILDSDKGAKGERHLSLKLKDAASANVGDVASEGEHRCIALAAFMAELSQASHKSALVFDDPVSSLDHKRRDAIAARLVKEVAHRQVVVFTHDLAFVCDLDSAARSASAQIHYQHIEWLADKPGRVLPGLVWDAQSYKDQMKTLNEQIGHAEKVGTTQGESEYREAAMPIVGRVRGACERIIEQHMINGVIKRHDSRIDVKNAVSIAAVTADQWKAVHAIWRACSKIIEAHTTPLSGPVVIPTPNKLKKWMRDLDKTVNDVKGGRESGGAVAQSKPASSPVSPA